MNRIEKHYRITASTTGIRIPSFFHDILGETTGLGELFSIGAITLLVYCLLWFLGLSDIVAFEGIRWPDVIGLLLTIDIIAGALANLTAGTNHYYAARPVNRLVFIAVHVQPLILHWLWYPVFSPRGTLLDSSGLLAVALWLYTILGALCVNGLRNRQQQQLIAGGIFVVGLTALMLAPVEIPMTLRVIYAVFLFKVAYAFAVNWELQPHWSRAQLARAVVAPAFNADPLFAAIRRDGWTEVAMARLMLFKAQALGERQFIAVDEQGVPIGIGSLEVRRKPLTDALRFLRPDFLLGIALLLATTGMPLSALKRLNRYMMVAESMRPKGAHGYIVFLAVHPEWQGQGVGKALLRTMLDAAKAQGLTTVALDTENYANLAYYQAQGFQSAGEAQAEAITIYGMHHRL